MIGPISDVLNHLQTHLSEVHLGLESILSIYSDESAEKQHAVRRWDFYGSARRSFLGLESHHPRVSYDVHRRVVPVHSLTTSFTLSLEDELFSASPAAKNQEILLNLAQYALAEKLRHIAFYGIPSVLDGLFNQKDATFVGSPGSLGEKKTLFSAILDMRQAALARGASADKQFRCLVPLEWEMELNKPYENTAGHMLPMTNREFLERFGLVFSVSQEYSRLVLYQDTAGQIYFHRRNEPLLHDSGMDPRNGERTFLISTATAGLVLSHPGDLIYHA